MKGMPLFAAMKGLNDRSARNFRVKNQRSAGRARVSLGEPVLVNDQGLKRVKTEYFVKSLLYVPMTYKNQTIGVLGVNIAPLSETLLCMMRNYCSISPPTQLSLSPTRNYRERLTQNRGSRCCCSGQCSQFDSGLGDVLTTLCRRSFRLLKSMCVPSVSRISLTVTYIIGDSAAYCLATDQGPTIALDKRADPETGARTNAF